MTYVDEKDLKDTWPIQIWLRIFTTVDTITLDWYRDKYDKKEFWEDKFNEKDKILIEYEKNGYKYPEFSKISWFAYAINDSEVKIITWTEDKILKDVNWLLDEIDMIVWNKQAILCWFNLYWFDIPYLWKRMVINWIKPNHYLRIAKIPVYNINNFIWDLNQLWKQTSWSASLPLIIRVILWYSIDNPYAYENLWIMLDRTRDCWKEICKVFS